MQSKPPARGVCHSIRIAHMICCTIWQTLAEEAELLTPLFPKTMSSGAYHAVLITGDCLAFELSIGWSLKLVDLLQTIKISWSGDVARRGSLASPTSR